MHLFLFLLFSPATPISLKRYRNCITVLQATSAAYGDAVMVRKVIHDLPWLKVYWYVALFCGG